MELIKGGLTMNKTISMSIRVSEDELSKLKIAAALLEYSSYSEFVRRTALIEASRIIKENKPLLERGFATAEEHGGYSK